MAQNLVVAVLVAGCFLYALWALAPKVLRRRLAIALLKWPLPSALQKPLHAAAKRQGGGGCDGCGRSAPAKRHQAKELQQPLVFMPRPGSVLGAKRERNQ